MSRVAVVKLTVHAHDMGALRELCDRERVISLKVSVAKSRQLSAWIPRIKHGQIRIRRTFEERHAPLPFLGALTQDDWLD
jgi:hypothetical protein